MSFYRYIAIIFCIPLLISCQASYTASVSEQFARDLGIINGFDIKRCNNRGILQDNHLIVVSGHTAYIDSHELSHSVADILSPFFRNVKGGYTNKSITDAIKRSKSHQSNFLIFIDVIDQSSLFQFGEVNAKTAYNGMRLSLNIVDINSGRSVDKILLTAKSSYFNPLGHSIGDLLKKPITVVAKDLTGFAP